MIAFKIAIKCTRHLEINLTKKCKVVVSELETLLKDKKRCSELSGKITYVHR